ncbi:MAG: hypothetical protein AAF611_12855 [Bacteroidota bacterium]
MKKQKIKLGLNKSKISDLSIVNGGNGPKWVVTITEVGNICCPEIESPFTDTEYRTIMNDTTCGLHCGFRTYEVYTCH